jgi:hypothetical protein
MRRLVEFYGWYGMVAIIVAYALASFSIIDATGLIFQILNGTGALGMVLISFKKKAYQPGALNILWTLIAVLAVARKIFH